jgi:dolichol-phosphate mannosyltransferase
MNQGRRLELAVVVPTFRERGNVERLLELLAAALEGTEYEVIFVDDDSPDGTAALVRQIGLTNPRVRVLQRIKRRGLSSACLEGMMSTAAPYIAVMDADLQHDERILPTMLNKLKAGSFDLVVATRNAEGGSKGEFAASRVRLSEMGRGLSRLVSRCDLSDPMSGFFLVDRRFLEDVAHSASGVGFKILLDLVASSPRPVRIAEVPYTFRKRLHGDSKLDMLVGLEYLQLLLDKMIGDVVPPRFVIFSLVGGLGVILHLTILFFLQRLGRSFVEAQTWATIFAMTSNFLINNVTTYRDRRLRGLHLLTGMLTFYLACSVGAFINIRLAEALKESGIPWYVAGVFGLGVGSVWNYGVSSILTWRQARQAARRRMPAAQRA